MSKETAQLLEAFEALPDSGPLDDDETAQAADRLLRALEAGENDAGPR